MFIKKDLVLEVMQLNAIRQDAAQKLNVRAGGPVFPVLRKGKLVEWIAVRLEGARRMKDVRNPANLLLSPLDAEMVELVERENPLQLELLGELRTVSYPAIDKPPSVTLGVEEFENRRWLELPDEGVFLPSGRQVAVSVQFAHGLWGVNGEAGTDLQELKEKLKVRANEATWGAWKGPELPVPSAEDESAVLPEVAQAVYGQCVITGADLAAYGTVAAQSAYYSATTFKNTWYRTREEAEAARSEAAKAFAAEQRKHVEQRKLDAASARAEELQKLIHTLVDGVPEKLTAESRTALNNAYYRSRPYDLANLEPYNAELESIVAKAEADIAEFARQRDLAQAKRDALAAIVAHDYATCPVCGVSQRIVTDIAAAEADTGQAFCGCCGEGANVHGLVAALDAGVVNAEATPQLHGIHGNIPVAAIRQSRQDGRLVTEVVAFRKWGAVNVHLRCQPANYELDGGEVETTTVWRRPSDRALRLNDLRRARDRYEDEREEADRQVAEGDVLLLTFRAGKNPKKGTVEMEAPGGKGLKYVVDSHCNFPVEAGGTYYCSRGRCLVDTGTFRLESVHPYLQRLADVDGEIARLEAEVEAENNPKPNAAPAEPTPEVHDAPEAPVAEPQPAHAANAKKQKKAKAAEAANPGQNGAVDLGKIDLGALFKKGKNWGDSH